MRIWWDGRVHVVTVVAVAWFIGVLVLVTSASASDQMDMEENVFLPLVHKHVQSPGDIICQHTLQDRLNIPKSLTHWIRLKKWSDFVKQVNSYDLKPGEESVLVRIVGGVGVGRLLSQMREINPKVSLNMKKGRRRKQPRLDRVKLGEKPSQSHEMMHYNVTIGYRVIRMSIAKDEYISKQIIDRGEPVDVLL
jgi:hypothetical protein